MEDIPFSDFVFLKMPVFIKSTNCCKITAQTTYFENIYHSKIYFHYSLILTKTNYYDSSSFFGIYTHFKSRNFKKMPIFLKVSNCRIILALTTYFENIQHRKIYFHEGII